MIISKTTGDDKVKKEIPTTRFDAEGIKAFNNANKYKNKIESEIKLKMMNIVKSILVP